VECAEHLFVRNPATQPTLSLGGPNGIAASDSRITARVGIGPTGHGGFGLQVALDLHAPHLPPAEAAELMARADQRCPYSNATRGNIQVTLSLDGTPIQQAAA
jgi:lipoyl-dependent peroxiredoxin